MRYFAIIGALALTGCLPFEEHKTIVVDGEASLEFAPEAFSISGAIRARTGTQADALKSVSETLARIRQTLPRLEGLTHLSIEASEVELRPIQDPECADAAPYGREAMCPVEGHFGTISLTVKASPATLSGQTLSLLSELGAESVSLTSFSLDNEPGAREAALSSAMEDARAKATKIAEAAGAAIGAPVKIQYGGGFPESEYGRAYADASPRDEIVVTGSRTVRPQTELDIEPQPIRVDAKVVAAFAIE